MDNEINQKNIQVSSFLESHEEKLKSDLKESDSKIEVDPLPSAE